MKQISNGQISSQSVLNESSVAAGGVCHQVRHVGAAASSVQTHAGEGSPAHRRLRKRQEGTKRAPMALT